MITKILLFVILIGATLVFSASCHLVQPQSDLGKERRSQNLSSFYEDPVRTGRIQSKKINESSGLAITQCNPDVIWTHNDSGNGAEVYALDLSGRLLSSWFVSGASNRDWEGMDSFQDKSGKCFLYVGDIGNNSRLRGAHNVYKFAEPNPRDKSGRTAPAKRISFSYPKLRHDAEALLVHPKTEDIYIVTKRASGAAIVYKLVNGSAKMVGEVRVPSIPNGLITGGAIDPTGTRVVLSDYFGGYELVLPRGEVAFDAIWKVKPKVVEIGKRKQGEAIVYSADGESVVATSEKKNAPIWKATRMK